MLISNLHLDPGETILHEVRKHWFVIFTRAVATLLLALFPLVIFGLAFTFFQKQITPILEGLGATVVFAYSLWLLILWVNFFIQWTNYYLDVWYITEKRIIDVEQKGLFHREVSNLRFDKIQDVTVQVRGPLATFFKYGDLKVQTAAQDSSYFSMKQAARPEEVRRIIFSRHNLEAEKSHHVHVVTPEGSVTQDPI